MVKMIPDVHLGDSDWIAPRGPNRVPAARGVGGRGGHPGRAASGRGRRRPGPPGRRGTAAGCSPTSPSPLRPGTHTPRKGGGEDREPGGGVVGLEKGTRKGRQPPTTSSQRSTPTPSWEGTDPSVAAKGAARGFTEPPPQSVAVTPPRLALANSIGRPHLPGGVPHPGRRPLGVGFLRCTVTTLKGEARLRRGGGQSLSGADYVGN